MGRVCWDSLRACAWGAEDVGGTLWRSLWSLFLRVERELREGDIRPIENLPSKWGSLRGGGLL